MSAERWENHGLTSDYVGEIDSKLRKLSGFRALLSELLQNADDADRLDGTRATSFELHVNDDALIAIDDGLFRECATPWARACANGPGHRWCDLHSFRLTASGNKRLDPERTGEFGIGFISVYQITDAPEVWTGRNRFIVHPEEEENKRLVRDAQAAALPETRLHFPWAFDAASPLRRRLPDWTVQAQDVERLYETALAYLPDAILFLRGIRRIVVRRNGDVRLTVNRIVDGETVHIECNGETRTYLKLERSVPKPPDPDFMPERFAMTADVSIVVPLDNGADEGRIYCTLPTETVTGMSVHVNAPFMATSDRRALQLGGNEILTRWNVHLLRHAAMLLAESAARLYDILPLARFWTIITAAQALSGKTAPTGPEYAVFWQALKPEIEQLQCVPTISGPVVVPRDARIADLTDMNTLTVAELGIALRSPELAFAHNALRGAGATPLSSEDLLEAVQRSAPAEGTPIAAAPAFVMEQTKAESLIAMLESLTIVARRRTAMGERLASIPLCIAADAHVRAAGTLKRASPPTLALLTELGAGPALTADDEKGFAKYASRLTMSDAIGHLASILTTEAGQQRLREGNRAAALLRWLDTKFETTVPSETRHVVRMLPMVPCQDGSLQPPAAVVVPGTFGDPLRCANIADPRLGDAALAFLVKLGVEKQSFAGYVKTYVVPILRDAADEDPTRVGAAIAFLAEHIAVLRHEDHEAVVGELGDCAFVRCEDGVLRAPRVVCIASDRNHELLGVDSFIAVENGAAAVKVLNALGAQRRPTANMIRDRINSIVSGPPEPSAVAALELVVSYLDAHRTEEPFEQLIESIRANAWLPARHESETWFCPQDLCDTTQQRLFSTQGRFLAFADTVQSRVSALLHRLGIRSQPYPDEVARDIIARTQNNQRVTKDVYSFLNEHVAEMSPNLVQALRTAPWLRVHDESVAAESVFWDHPFGRLRTKLERWHEQFRALFDRLGVPSHGPDGSDALRVLGDIADATDGSPLDDELVTVVHAAWELVQTAMHDKTISPAQVEAFAERTVVLNRHHVLGIAQDRLFADSPRCEELVGDQLDEVLVHLDHRTKDALRAVGVERLSGAVRQTVLSTERERDTSLEGVIAMHRNSILRALQATVDSGAAESAQRWLDDIRVATVPELQVRISVPRFGILHETPRRCALSDGFLLVQQGHAAWTSMATELVSAFARDVRQHCNCAGLIAYVLGCPTAEAGRMALDECDVPHFDSAVYDRAVVAEASPDDEIPANAGDDDGVESCFTQRATERPEPPADPPMPARPPTGAERTNGVRISRSEYRSSTTTPASAHAPQRGRRIVHGRRHRLISYLLAPTANDVERSPEKQAHIDAVDAAAIRAVMAYEFAAGRSPLEREHRNPGYDIESTGIGERRFIEVKGLSEAWGDLGASFTVRQFHEAERSDEWWLYVVEEALGSKPMVYRLQNPVRRANEFRVDAGWKVLAEPG